MKRKRILLDVDEVICFPGFLNAINEFLNTNYEIDYFNDYYIDEAVMDSKKLKEFSEYIKDRNLYEDARLLPNARKVIEELNKVYDIYICSSCINPFDLDGSGKLFKDKYNYLRKELPFLDPKKYIFTESKNLIKADIQIDDRVSNLKNNTKIKILFPSYHNKEVNKEEIEKYKIIRAGYDWRNGWEEVANILLKK